MNEPVPAPLRFALRGRYEIRRELGRGGTAIVYEADDLKHDRRVALKVLRPEIAVVLGPERFLREIRLAAKLQHPHILPLLDSGEAEGWLYYVLPCVEGPTLRQRLDAEGQLSLDECLRVIRDVCGALSYAHGQGIVHRDVKPENILLAGEHSLVTDFGIAQALTAAAGEKLTETGIAVGTPAYMSPEQAGGAARVDGRADVYAVGCVLYEMLAGTPPFTGPTAQALLARHTLDPVPPLRTVRRSVPVQVERVVMKALEKSPADRFQSVAELAEALAAPPSLDGRRFALRGAGAVSLGVAALAAAAWAAGIGRGTESTPMQRIAVLPPENLGGDPGQDYFVDGIHDALIAELAQIEALSVISRPTMSRYRGTGKLVPEIATELGVQGVVATTLLVVGDSVRVTATLIDGRTDRPLWAETYERDLRDLLRLYGELATAVAEAVQVVLTPSERTRLGNSRDVDPAVYDLALLGRHECWKWTEDGFVQGIRYLEDAVGRDPASASAHAWLAMCYADQAFFTYARPTDAYPRAREVALRAIALDPTLAEAHAAVGLIRHSWDLDLEGPERDYRRALELSPGSVPIMLQYSAYLTLTGRFDEAIEVGRRAIELDPFTETTNLNLGWTYFKAHRYDDAIAALRNTLALFPSYWFAHAELGWAYAAKGMHQEAVAQCDSARVRAPQVDDQVLFGTCGWVYGRAGQRGSAHEMAARLNEIAGRRWLDPVYLAWVQIGLGDGEAALASLRAAVEERSPTLVFLPIDPMFDPIRARPGFQELLSELGMTRPGVE